jgi:acetylornithine deacetylase/succinyl-diaminopimelate desuccinylase-like protein
VYCAVTAVQAVQRQGLAHGRIVVLIEASEESGSVHLPVYLERLADRIGIPSLIVCLDSGCGNYDSLWVTTTLRGVMVGELRVSLIEEGVHSGDSSGIVPSSFRVIRQLLDRIEDAATGRVLLKDLWCDTTSEKAVRLAQKMQVGPCIPVGTQL